MNPKYVNISGQKQLTHSSQTRDIKLFILSLCCHTHILHTAILRNNTRTLEPGKQILQYITEPDKKSLNMINIIIIYLPKVSSNNEQHYML